MPPETMTKPRVWGVPAEPKGVTKVRAANLKVWRITDCPSVDPGTHRWVQVITENTADPFILSWRSLARLEGPLTEVAD